jgi:protein-tyrosine phosphatase
MGRVVHLADWDYARDPTAEQAMPTSVLFVCLGNICRSPLAHGLFEAHLATCGRADAFAVDSAGTSGYHAGEAPDPGSIREAARHGLDITGQRSRPLVARDFDRFDFIIAMDTSNLRAIRRMGNLPPERLFRILEFDSEALSFDVPDPWGGGEGGFRDVYAMLERSMAPLLAHIDHHGPRRD